MKLVFLALVCFTFLLSENLALEINNYTAYIEELMQDEKFLDEYARWSFQLFSQPDYLYGDLNKTFPCQDTKDSSVPTSVHSLRPSNVKCVGAMGDSLTAALGAHAITPIGLFFENRGLSWSVGGDHTYNTVLSVPNALRSYNPELEGYSTKVSVIFLNGQDAKNNHLNVAKSGDRSTNMSYQADLIMSRLKQEELCDWDNDWKVITLFVGGNDLCSFCEDPGVGKHTPEQYLNNVRDALDKLYNAPLPRTFVNLVLVLDVRTVKDLNSGGFVCQTLHKRTCPCAAFPTPEQAKTLDVYVGAYQDILIDLVNSGRYDGREDFTVVIQPFMSKTKLPYKTDHTIDFSYFAPDCFHFSGKGHAQAALSLWNNMLEPVGAKQQFWHMGENLECPTDQHPYFFTKKNSAAALEEYKRKAAAAATETTSTTSSAAAETTTSAATETTTSAATETTTSAAQTSTTSDSSSTDKHKHRKHHKSDEYSSYQFAAFAAFFVLFMLILMIAISRRQQIRVFVHGTGRRHLGGFVNPQYPDDMGEDEIWNRPNTKLGYTSNSGLPKTHGTRINFE